MILNIGQHISDLLFKHDCVILPGFGGFVGNYSAARVHPINHTFYPPSKNILFNSNLTGDDGLLTHSLSVAEEISYEEAKAVLKSFIKECRERLKEGKVLTFDKIGTIRRDVEGSLLFSQDNTVNYLEESYALPSFVSHPIIRKKIHRQPAAKFIDRKPVSERNKKKRAIYLVYLAIIPILFLLGWYFLPFNSDKNNNTQESSFAPSTEQTSEPIVIKKDILVENTEPTSNEIEEAVPPPEESLSEATSKKASPGSNSAIFQEKKPLYLIIGGAFQFKTNSQKLIARLNLKGYNAEYAGLSRHGLHMVCYLKTKDKNEALMNLAIIRKQDNPSAWLLKRK
jgi:nucleoid DNA-binding protein